MNVEMHVIILLTSCFVALISLLGSNPFDLTELTKITITMIQRAAMSVNFKSDIILNVFMWVIVDNGKINTPRKIESVKS